MKIYCEDFLRALQLGTDNEGYGSAIWDINKGKKGDEDPIFYIGACGKKLNFCPWCGKPI